MKHSPPARTPKTTLFILLAWLALVSSLTPLHASAALSSGHGVRAALNADHLSAGGAGGPAVTPIPAPPDIFVRDAKAAEPASGSTNMIFTVALSAPAASNVTVSFTTSNDTGGAAPATAGADYATTTGVVTFLTTQQVKTISVPVLAEGMNPASVETISETLRVNLSTPVGGTIADGQAVGTITGPQAPGTVQITELRTSGPGGAGDDFVEVYNNSDTPLNTGATGWALVASNNGCSGSPVLVGLIPPATTIPVRGHYLFRGSQYSLADYGDTGNINGDVNGDTGLAAGDQTLLADLGNDVNVGLFETNTLVNISSLNRRDAVGFGLNTSDTCDLLREGATLPTASGSTSQHSFVRKVTLVAANVPTPTDTHNNATDFHPVSTTANLPISLAIPTPILGAPGPENRTGPNIKKFSQIAAQPFDATKLLSSAPNRMRRLCTDPEVEECLAHRSSQGTLSLRRRFVNNSGVPVTRLRFRFYLINTLQGPSVPLGTADLRVLSSHGISVPLPGVGARNVQGTTLEESPVPAQFLGGGMNSSVVETGVSPINPMRIEDGINIQFLFGVQQGGSYSVLVYIEAQ